MTYTRRDLEQMCRKLHLDLNDAQQKVRQLMQAVSSLPIPESKQNVPVCPTCGPLKAVTNERQLWEHMANVHGVYKAVT